MPYIPQITVTLLISTILFASSLAAPSFRPTLQEATDRQAKNLAYFDYIQPEMDYDNYGIENDDYVSMAIDENELSRTIPSRKRLRPPPYNSPIYYIRLPPQPYMFVPGKLILILLKVDYFINFF